MGNYPVPVFLFMTSNLRNRTKKRSLIVIKINSLVDKTAYFEHNYSEVFC